MAFGNQTVGTLSGSRSVTVTNTGTANLVITSVALSGGETADFPNLTTNCATLAPGAQCIITLAFAPNAVGNRATNIVVVDNVPSAGSAQIIPVSSIAPGTPSVGLNPPSVDFGDQQVNTQSGAQAVTITNTGTATLTLSNAPVLFGGDTSQFQIVSDGCGVTTLTPGASCTVAIRFTPTSVGQKSATLVFTSNISGTFSIVTLTGNGVAAGAPAATANPASIDFGSVQIGQVSGAQAVTITNTGAGNLVFSAAPQILGTDASYFPLLVDGCGTQTLVPGASCTVTVRFAPTGTAASRSASLTFTSNVSGTYTIVSLTGTATAVPTTAPFASLSVGALGFGDQLINTRSAAQAVTLTNTGTGTLTFSGAPTFFGGDTSQFEIVSDSCWAGGPGTLAPGASCTVTVRFEPDAPAATRSATLAFATNASGSPHLVNLTGVGSAVPVVAPFAVVTPSAINFGSQQQGTQSGAQAVTITNTGTANLVFGPGTPIGLASITNFNILTNGCPGAAGTLAPGASCTVVVRFAPTTTGNLSTTLSFADNSSGGSPQLVVLNGVGTAAPVTAPQINFTPASVNFGNQQQGVTSGAQTIVVENVGNDNLFISAIIPVAINGGNAADFAILSNNCPSGIIIPLQPGAQCTVSVTFTPTALGQRSSALRFVDNDNNVIGASQYVPLEGVGVPAGVAIAPASIDFGSVLQGTNSGAQAATITNTGSASITLTGPINTANNIVGGNTSDFVVVNSACPVSPATLAPGVSCTVTLRFTPGGAVTGNRASTFQVVTSAGTVQTVLNGFASPTPVTNPFATLSAATLSFGDQVVNTPSASQSVTITNTGNGNLTFTAPPSFGGPDAAMFSPLVSDGCGTQTLIPGASCTVVVRFTPTSVGQKSATLVFTSNISGTYSIVNLTGNGVSAGNAVASVDPAVVNFGDVALNTSAAQTVTVTNTGTGALGITGFTPSSAPFTISGNSCTVGTVLQPNASCSFAVTFAPTATGAASSSVVIASNVPGGSTTINVSGFGVSSVIAFTPPPVNFGSVAIGSGSTLGLLVTNTGSGPLTITGVGGLAAPFSIEGDTCSGQTLAPGASCVLDIKFQPTAPGYVFDSVGVVTTTGTFSSVVDGTGTLTPVAAVTLNPGAINFGEVPTGTSVARTVTVSNTGDAPLGITSVGIAGSGYAISGNGCIGQILNPGQSCTFAVTFSPATGANTGTVTVTTSVGAPTIALTGIGVSSVLSFTPAPLNFGQLSVGTSSTLGVLITNTGGGPVSISSVGGLAGPYSITGTTCTNVTLGAGESCAVTVQFSPGAAGYFADALEVSNTIPAVIASSAVVGSAVAAPTPALTISPAVLNFGSVSVGANASQTVTLSNTGSAPFNITGISGAGGAFSVSGNGCTGTTLNPGDSCTFAVTFAPTAAGATSVTLSISDTAPGNPHSLSATGTGVSSVLSFTPNPLDFGNVTVGTSSTLGVLVTNTGGAPVAITAVGGPSGDFALVSTTCVATLAPGDSCSVVVRYTPSAPGADVDSIDLTVTGVGTVSSGIVGNGVVAPVPTVTIQPTSLDFGDVQIGTTSPALPLTVTNTGSAPLNISTLGTGNAAFVLSANGCAGATLQPGESCVVGVTFTPAAVGQTTSVLQINDNAGGVATSQFVSLTGNGISAGLAVTPGSLDFGNQQVNTSSAVQTVTVTNVGLGTITISAVTPAGTFSTFADTCTGQTLGSGDSCTVGVRFNPNAVGQATGTLTFTTTGPDPIVSLVGVGISAQLSVTPGSLDFGPHQLGTSTPAQTVTVKNIGTGSVTITATALAGSDPTNFEITGNSCQPSGNDVTLAAGQECTISVRFTPVGLVAGNRSALLNITSNAPAAASVMSVGLAGIATTGAVYVTPASLDFGDQQLGTTSVARTVTVTNAGTGPVTFVAPAITGNFAIFANTCTLAALAPGDSCTIGVVFQPVTPGGPKTGTLTITDTASPLAQTVSLTGNAISAQLSVTPSTLDFGNQTVNTQSVSQTVTVKNVGSGPVTITSTTPVLGNNPADFLVVADTCQPGGNDVTLAAGETCTISVLFQPSATGARNAQLTITSNAPATGSTVAVSLLGFGVTSGPAISFNPSSLDFGSIPVNTSATRTITVTNSGTAPLIFNASAVTLTGSAAYSLTGNTCNGVTLLPGESCTVGVTFAPTTQGPTAATTLAFASNAPGSPHSVNVTGIGTSAVFSFNPLALNFGNVQVGSTSTLSVLVTNNTGGPARITGISGIGAPFTLVGDSCTNVLLPDGESCALTVTFAPAAVGYFSNTATLNLSTGGSISLALTGTGTPIPTPLISITPASLDFGYVQNGQVAPAQTVTIKNIGSIDVAISSAAITLGGANFVESADTCSGQILQPGQTCTYSVTFAPGATTGPIVGAVTITSNAPSSTHIVPLFGNGITAGLSIAPASLNFGNVQVGTASVAQVVTVTNTGSGPVTISNYGIIGTDAAQYEVVDSTCMSLGNPSTLPPGGSCTFAVRFKPPRPARRSPRNSASPTRRRAPRNWSA
ncbi:MAG: choice-of-anchor D domain-containing protein [Chloroflexia bacterium]